MPRSQHAAMLLAALAVVTSTGCTDRPAPEPKPAASPGSANGPSPASSDTTATGMPPKRLKPPPTVAGELSRRVLSSKDGHPSGATTLGGSARAGQEYVIQAACTSTTPGKTLSVEVRSAKPGASDAALAAVEVPCDGTPTVIGIGDHPPAEPVGIYLPGDQSDVVSAYAVVAPPSPAIPSPA